MKLSNNALNFLLAQYRAIFKRAYVKGLASAVILTAGLAAGAANTVQAASNLTEDVLTANKSGSFTVTGADQATAPNYTHLNISGSVTDFSGTISITDQGQATQNIVSGSGSLAGSGTLNINTTKYEPSDNVFPGLRVESSTADQTASVSLGTINLEVGSISAIASASGAGVDVTAQNINIGTAGGTERAVVNLGNQTAATENSGSVTFGAAATDSKVGSLLTIDGRGNIQMNGATDSGSVNLAADRIVLNNGTIRATGFSSTAGSNKITSHEVTINGGLLEVEQNGNLTLDLAQRKSADASGNLIGDTANEGHIDVYGGTLKINGTLQLSDGELNIQSGTITGTGTLEVGDKLTVSSTTLAAFVDQNNTESGGTVKLTTGGDLTFTDATDLSDFTWATGTASSGSDFVISGNTTVRGTNLAISSGLQAAGDDTDLTTGGNAEDGGNHITVRAENLTLGNGAAGSLNGLSGSGIMTFSVAKNLTLNPSGEYFTFSNNAAMDVFATNLDADATGTINGNIDFADKNTRLLVKGAWDYNGDLKFSSTAANQHVNSIIVGNSKQVSSSLAFDGTITNANAVNASSAIMATKDGTLDLTGARFVAASNNVGGVGFIASASGAVIIDGEDLTSFLNESNKGFGVKIESDGELQVNGSVSANFADFVYDKTALNEVSNKLVIAKGSTGTIVVDGALTLTTTDTRNATSANGAAQELDLHGLTLEVDSLSVTDNVYDGANGALNADVALKSGDYYIGSALRSQNATLKLGSGADTFFGSVEGVDTDSDGLDDYYIGSTSGTIDPATLEVDTGASAKIRAGAWTAKNITVSGGTMTVGALNGENTYNDQSGNAITASLAGDALIVNGGSFTVERVASATFDSLNTTGAQSIVVNGSLTIDDAAVSGTASAATETAQVATAGAISVGSTGSLTFGADVVKNSIYSGTSGDVVLFKDGFAENAIELAANGQVTLAFGSDVSFNSAQLVSLKQKLFNNDTNGSIIGVLNVGDAQIGNLKFDDDNGTPTIGWDQLDQNDDVTGSGVTTSKLSQARVEGVSSSAEFQSHVGSVVTTDGSLSVVGNASMSNAAGNNGFFVSDSSRNQPGNATVNNGSDLALNGAGEIGSVTLNGGSVGDQAMLVTGGTATDATKIASVSGDANSKFLAGAANTQVVGNVDVGEMETVAGTTTSIGGNVDVVGKAVYDGRIDIKGNASFEDNVEFNNQTSFGGNLSVDGDALITGETSATSGNTQFNGDVDILQGAQFTANNVKLAAAAQGNVLTVSVGSDTYTDNAGTEHAGSTGYFEVGNFTLNGNQFVVDPDYGEATSIAAVGKFTEVGNTANDIGTLNGTVIVGQNAALMVGEDASIAAMQDAIARYQTDGSLSRDNVGAVVYLTSDMNVAANSQIIIDPTRSKNAILGVDGELSQVNGDSDYYGQVTAGNYQKADLYLGQNSVLAIDESAVTATGAIHFDKDQAYIKGDSGSKIVLAGDSFLNSQNIKLFTDKGTGAAEGVYVLDNDIRVETLNGLMYFTLEAGKETTGKTLQLDTSKVDTAFSGATDVGRNMLLAFASRTANFNEYYDPANLAKADTDETKVEREVLVAGVAAASEAVLGADGQTITVKAPNLSTDDFTIDHVDNGDGTTTPVLYRIAHNDLLEAMSRDTNGRAFDSAAELGVFAGSAQAALLVAQTSQDAVAGRTGIGATSSALTFADNGQGAGLWINPIYISQDSDGFNVANKDYGVDIDLYGVALGGDYTLANGIRLGAFFNLGSGDSEGNGQASQVSADFDYWGLGLYAGYSMGAFSVVGDFSYSVVDTDAEAGTEVGTLTSSYDTDIISVGVTGQYEFDFGGAKVTPHAGLRYSSISIDDFDLGTSSYQDGGHFDADRANVFSIPVGVTVAKEFAFDTWTVKPSFDLTLQGNFGDDEIDSNNSWDGVANMTTQYSAEFLDNFTYGATVGVAAKTGNFSLGLGLGYTGSSNTDSFNATANARFTF